MGRIKSNEAIDTKLLFSSVQFSSVAQLCPTLCDPMNCSTPSLPVHAKLGSIKDRQGPNRSRRYSEEVVRIQRRTVQKNLQDPDSHDGVITHLEPDILECKVKWALGSITMNKASGGDGIPGELFQIQKYDAVKVLHSICQQIWKIQKGPQD